MDCNYLCLICIFFSDFKDVYYTQDLDIIFYLDTFVTIFGIACLKVIYIYDLNWLMCNKHSCFTLLQGNSH